MRTLETSLPRGDRLASPPCGTPHFPSNANPHATATVVAAPSARDTRPRMTSARCFMPTQPRTLDTARSPRACHIHTPRTGRARAAQLSVPTAPSQSSRPRPPRTPQNPPQILSRSATTAIPAQSPESSSRWPQSRRALRLRPMRVHPSRTTSRASATPAHPPHPPRPWRSLRPGSAAGAPKIDLD